MTMLYAFAQALQAAVGATLNTDLFISRVPSSDHVGDSVWLVKSYGGTRVSRARTGETQKNYLIQVVYRDRDAGAVDSKLFALEELLNGPGLVLDGFTVIEMEVFTFPIDNDLDDEDRQVGVLQAQISTYKENQ